MQEKLKKSMYIAMYESMYWRVGRNVKVENEVQFSTLLNNLAFEVNPKVHRYRTLQGTYNILLL